MNALNNSFRFTSGSPEETQEFGRHIGALALPGDVYLLSGNLGAGKTCFTQGIAAGLGIEEYVMSPSFVLMREHHGRLPLYHIDLYRLASVTEAVDLGLDEYLYGKGVCVVEWTERAPGIMPGEHLSVHIDYRGDCERDFRLEGRGNRYSAIIGELKKIYGDDETGPC